VGELPLLLPHAATSGATSGAHNISRASERRLRSGGGDNGVAPGRSEFMGRDYQCTRALARYCERINQQLAASTPELVPAPGFKLGVDPDEHESRGTQ
jgi:hypothetical protein